MKEETKSTEREEPKRDYRSAQFAEIGSVPELTQGGGGDSRDTGGWCIPVNASCKWGDATDPKDES